MFRQILIHPDDLNWQRLLWRETSTSPINEFQATTVTYGTASTPFLAIRSLVQLASDGQNSLKSTYVDDVFLGDDDEILAQAQRDELIDLLASAGMTLCKWSSNRPELLQSLPGQDITELPTSSGEITSTLGLKWDTGADVFLFEATLPPIAPFVTKRTILSDTVRLYDPLGFIAPILIQEKILLQDLWILQLDWDVPLPRELLDRWLSFRSALPKLTELKIPRWTGISTSSEWQLHGFADASKRAYAAVVYAVVPGLTSIILMAKSRVPPVKVETIPRLELCGALLLVYLAKHLISGITQLPESMHFWSDSEVVLDWLQGHPSRWPTFVANRISQINQAFPDVKWRHVLSKDNPADYASHGMGPEELAKYELWWKGPSWLDRPRSEWPALHLGPPPDPISATMSELLQTTALFATNDDFLHSLEKFSDLAKLLRVLAYCLRWRRLHCRENSPRIDGLSVREVTQAKHVLFRLIQFKYFSTEFRLISVGKPVSSSSVMACMGPFLDENQLIRVGGDLHHSSLPYAERHPIILPGRCCLVRLLVEEAHRLTLHGGIQLMKSFIDRSYWIIRGIRLISAVYRNCITCICFGARRIQQQMAPLPAERLKRERPFSDHRLRFCQTVPPALLQRKGS